MNSSNKINRNHLSIKLPPGTMLPPLHVIVAGGLDTHQISVVLRMPHATDAIKRDIFGQHVDHNMTNNPVRGPPKPQKGKQKSKPMKLMETTENDDDDDDSTVFVGRFAINKLYQKKDNTIWVTLSINGTPLRMELDTGSAVSIISKGDYLQKFSNLELHSTQVKLKTYTEKITPVGLLRVSIEYQGQQFGGELYVIDRGGSALFGRDWLTHLKLDWPNILAMSVENQVDTAAKLKALIEEYDELFKEEIGELKGIKGNLVLKDNAQPVFLKARQVPYALRPKIEAELVKLQRENIITLLRLANGQHPLYP